ncbi:MAG: HAMP domain-containing histidine kinase [Leptospiraceae bacterium]|nr:HAMP domain-containing histidine kinase [Leptospiraceae bacterium]
MGLFICKYIVEAHNGKLHIESMEGVGTICKIRLPFLTNRGII